MTRPASDPRPSAPRYLIYAKGPAPHPVAGHLVVRRVRIVQDISVEAHGTPSTPGVDGYAVFDLRTGELANLFVVSKGRCLLEWQLEPLAPDAPLGALLPVRYSSRRRTGSVNEVSP